MNGPEFDSLLYTDCVVGQGLRGGAGFQFQAVSSGVRHETMNLVQREALYEPPVEWMRAKRPVSDYPASLTHISDGVYVTARGVYLGAEVNGAREGNQFTHAIATDDTSSYGLIRPAQLWNAHWWFETPAPSTECDTVPAEPESGPHSLDAVREWLLGITEAESWLTAVHSALDELRESGRRIIFVGEDPGEILLWITAATLLLPQKRALRVGFRVFATNPRYSQQDIVALHPEWAGEFTVPDRDHEFVVFNLSSGQHGSVESSDVSAYWVSRFLREDPYDVVDAVELAHQFAGAGAETEASPKYGDCLASGALTFHEPVGAQAELLAEWISERTSDASEEMEQLVDALLGSSPSTRALWTLVCSGHPAVRSQIARVRQAILRAEIDEVVTGRGRIAGTGDGPIPELGQGTETPGEETESTELVEAAANVVEPARMGDLLELATRFRLTPEVSRFDEAARRFVHWWIDRPDLAVNDPARWSCSSAMLALLRSELAVRLDSASSEKIAQDIRRYWWRLLAATVTDPLLPVDSLVASSAIEQGESAAREEIVATVLRRLPTEIDSNSAELSWMAMFRYEQPTVDELVRFLREIPRGAVRQPLAERLLHVVDAFDESALTARHLDAMRLLARQGWRSNQPELVAVTTQDEYLDHWLATCQTARQGQTSSSTSALRHVSTVVFSLRAPEVLATLLEKLPLSVSFTVVSHGGHCLWEMLLRQLPLVWEGEARDRNRRLHAVALFELMARSETCPPDLESRFDAAIRRWVRRADESERDSVGRLLAEANGDAGLIWDEWIASMSRKESGSGRKSATNKAWEAHSSEMEEAKKPRIGKVSQWLFGNRGRR